MLSRSALRPRKQNSRKADAWKRCPQFLQWLRGRPCMFADRRGCDGKIVAAHVDYAGGKGIATKVADQFAVPMCGGPDGHHAAQHRWGWATFEANFKMQPGGTLEASKAYWSAWPGRIAWEARHES